MHRNYAMCMLYLFLLLYFLSHDYQKVRVNLALNYCLPFETILHFLFLTVRLLKRRSEQYFESVIYFFIFDTVLFSKKNVYCKILDDLFITAFFLNSTCQNKNACHT